MRRWDWLASQILANGWTHGAELGVFKGDTYLYLLRNCPELTLIGVDLWAAQPQTPGQEDKLGRDFDGFLANIRRLTAGNSRAILIQDWTVNAASQIEDGTLDFIFVDADHSYESVKADLLAWMPKVKEGGWIIGHDINWTSVKQAADELLPNYFTGPDNCYAAIYGRHGKPNCS